MKIALVSDAYFDKWNTVSSHIDALAKGLSDLGNEVRIFTSDVNTKSIIDEDTYTAFPGVPSYSSAAQGTKIMPLFLVSSRLEEFAPDLIHVFSISALSYAAVQYAIKNDLPAVCTVFNLNGIIPEKNNSSLLKSINRARYALLAKKIFSKCDKVLAFEKNIHSLISEYCEEEKLQDIPLYSDTGVYSPKKIDYLKVRDFKESYDIGFNKTAFLFAGDLSNTDILDSLFETWSGCVTPSDKIQLVIAGDGIEYEALCELAKIHGISSKIIFLEDITHEQMPLCYSACDAFIMPLDKNALYIEPLEAVSCGTAVILNKKSPNANLALEGKNCFTYSSNNELRKLISNFVTLTSEQKTLVSRLVASTASENGAVKQANAVLNVYDSLF